MNISVGISVGGGISKMLKFYIKVFYVMGKVLSGKVFCVSLILLLDRD